MHDGDAVWLEKRVGRGMFGGLYEPPSVVVEASAAARDDDDNDESDGAADEAPGPEQAWAAICAARDITPPATWPKPIVVSRTLTHRALSLEVCALRVARRAGGDDVTVDAGAGESAHWVSRAALSELGLSSAVRAVLKTVWPAPDGPQQSLF